MTKEEKTGNNSSGAKKHHINPCGYLVGFSGYIHTDKAGKDDIRKSMLFCISKQNGKILNMKTENIGYKKYHYSLIDNQGNKSNFVEDFLGSNVDSKIRGIVKKIDSRLKLYDHEIRDLINFANIQKVRGKEIDEDVESHMTLAGRYFKTEEEKDKYRRKIRNISIKTSIDFVHRMNDEIFGFFNYIIIIQASKGREFITCDEPYLINQEDGKILKGIYFPLSKTSCIYLTSDDGEGYYFSYLEPNVNYINVINKLVVESSNHFIFSSSKKILEKIQNKYTI